MIAVDPVEAIREQLYIANLLKVAELTENPHTRQRRLDEVLVAMEHTAPEGD